VIGRASKKCRKSPSPLQEGEEEEEEAGIKEWKFAKMRKGRKGERGGCHDSAIAEGGVQTFY
jgi:hypothetical protein